MGSRENRLNSDLKEITIHIFRDFLTGITKIDELVSTGNSLLLGFQQALEFLRRPPIDRTSELVDKIIAANETMRVKSYFEAGCINTHDAVQNLSKLNSCKHGLMDHLSKAKVIVTELDGLLEDMTNAIQTTFGNLPPIWDMSFGDELNEQSSTENKEEMALSHFQSPHVTHFATLMAIIYSMVKQDYVMQEKIISALNMKSSSGELESYCLMWSLRPYINEEVMHQAWKHIP